MMRAVGGCQDMPVRHEASSAELRVVGVSDLEVGKPWPLLPVCHGTAPYERGGGQYSGDSTFFVLSKAVEQ